MKNKNQTKGLASLTRKPVATGRAAQLLARSKGAPVITVSATVPPLRKPFTVVIDCPHCQGAHVVEKLESVSVFACKEASQTAQSLSFEPSLLKLVEVT